MDLRDTPRPDLRLQVTCWLCYLRYVARNLQCVIYSAHTAAAAAARLHHCHRGMHKMCLKQTVLQVSGGT